MSDSPKVDGPQSAGESISAVYKKVSNFVAIPDEGTFLRPIIRSLRLAVAGRVSDVSNVTEREVKALAQNIKETVDNTGEKLSTDVLLTSRVTGHNSFGSRHNSDAHPAKHLGYLIASDILAETRTADTLEVLQSGRIT